jgi:hypothetical protein
MATSNYHISNVVIPAPTFALVSVEMAKDYLQIPANDVSQDGTLGVQIAQVSAAINSYCDRVFVRQSYRDQFRMPANWLGAGEPLVTRQRPIVTALGVPIVSVVEDGATITEWEAYCGPGHLYRLNGGSAAAAWAGALVVVDYEAGFELIPEDVQGACLQWLSSRWTSRGHNPMLKSQTIPDVVAETYFGMDSTMQTAAMPNEVQQTLMNYRIWSV